jgi:hypothetical protein
MVYSSGMDPQPTFDPNSVTAAVARAIAIKESRASSRPPVASVRR